MGLGRETLPTSDARLRPKLETVNPPAGAAVVSGIQTAANRVASCVLANFASTPHRGDWQGLPQLDAGDSEISGAS